jgi:RNA polymerase sigma-70 factor (ECF subfamily)
VSAHLAAERQRLLKRWDVVRVHVCEPEGESRKDRTEERGVASGKRRPDVLLQNATAAAWPSPPPAASMSLDPTLAREFEQRVIDSSGLAFRVALAVLRQPADAEDVAQEAFLRAHRAFTSLRDRNRFRGWLVRVAFRLALDRQRGDRRRRHREDAVALEVARRNESVEETATRAEVKERVTEAVDALPEKLRIVTLLAAIEGHDVAGVARLLDLPEGTVKSRLHAARKVLAKRLRCLVSDTSRR